MQSTLPACSSRHVFGAQRLARGRRVVVRAETVTRDKPAWTGDSILSKVVNWAIDTPPLYGAMKVLAKNAMKSSAESRGIKWDAHVKEMQNLKELEAIKAELEDPALQPYPDYYLKPFHAYETGNLEWLAAWEVEPATYAIGIRTFKDHPEWSAEKCFVEMRRRMTDALKSYHAQHGLPLPRRIVDMGCSTGMSTTWFAQQFPDTDGPIVGLDLSPYMLAVAEWERRRREAAAPAAGDKPRSAPIKYIHGLAEKSPFDAASQDMVVFNFVIHECPQRVIDSFVQEGLRVVKPSGVLCFIDNNPKSKTIQNLPAPIFTLMKSTEPWTDEYYSYDLEAAMRAAGFREVVTVDTDHRHRCVMGIRP